MSTTENVKLIPLPTSCTALTPEEAMSHARACVRNSIAPLEAEVERLREENAKLRKMVPCDICGGSPLGDRRCDCFDDLEDA